MPNEPSPKAALQENPAQELGEDELETVAGGAGDTFDGEYVLTDVNHASGGTARVSKIEAITIKQK